MLEAAGSMPFRAGGPSVPLGWRLNVQTESAGWVSVLSEVCPVLQEPLHRFSKNSLHAHGLLS